MTAQNILCVRRSTLEEHLGGSVPIGFTADPHALAHFRAAVAAHGEWRPRPALEEDPVFLQVIVQGVVTNGEGILALFRKAREQKAGQFVETRHNLKVALSAGGHVEPVEAAAENILEAAQLRELLEEVGFEHPPAASAIRPLGLICTATPDAPLFQRVHIGYVSLVPVRGAVSLPAEQDEFDHLEFISGTRLTELLPRMEEWGQLIARAVIEQRVALAAR